MPGQGRQPNGSGATPGDREAGPGPSGVANPPVWWLIPGHLGQSCTHAPGKVPPSLGSNRGQLGEVVVLEDLRELDPEPPVRGSRLQAPAAGRRAGICPRLKRSRTSCPRHAPGWCRLGKLAGPSDMTSFRTSPPGGQPATGMAVIGRVGPELEPPPAHPAWRPP